MGVTSHIDRRIVWHASSGPQLNRAQSCGPLVVWHASSGPQLNVAQNCGPLVPSSWQSLRHTTLAKPLQPCNNFCKARTQGLLTAIS